MKKLLYILFMLCASPAFAQYFHTQHTAAGGPSSITNTSVITMADGNLCYASTHFDSLFHLVKISATTGAVLQKRSFLGTSSNPLPDTIQYFYNTTCFPTRDTGLAVVFTQNNYTNPTDSSQIVVIKLNKNLQVQWALSEHYLSLGSDWLSIPAIASDNSGNVIMSYTKSSVGGSTTGICKVAPSGNIILNKKYPAQPATSLFSVGTGRYLGIASVPYFSSGNTTVTTCVLDDQLNVTKIRSYVFPNDMIALGGFNSAPLPNNNQLLVGGPAFQYIPLGGNNYQVMQNSYYVSDTTGRLLFVKNVPGISPYSPAKDLFVSADNKLYLAGSEAENYLAVLDTAGNTLYTKDMSASELYPLGAPFTTGNDVLLSCQTLSTQGFQLSTDLVRFRNDGFLFCPGATSAIVPTFTDLAFNTVTASIPTPTTGTLTLQSVQIDTVAGAQISATTLCTTSAGVNEVPAAERSTLIYAGNYTVNATLPPGVHTGSLLITDLNGRGIIKTDLHSNKETVQLPQVPAGIYTWQLFYGNNRRDAGKFLVQ